jgi:hypothetical protein
MLPVGLVVVMWLSFRCWFHVLRLKMWRFSTVFLCFCLLWGAAGPLCCILCHVYRNTVHTQHITKPPLKKQHNTVHTQHITKPPWTNNIIHYTHTAHHQQYQPVQSATKNLIMFYSNLMWTTEFSTRCTREIICCYNYYVNMNNNNKKKKTITHFCADQKSISQCNT